MKKGALQDEVEVGIIVTFQRGGYWYGVPLSHVVELIEPLQYREVVNETGPFVGIATHTSHMIPLIDLTRVFGHRQTSPLSVNSWLIISLEDSSRAALTLDGSAQLVEAKDDELVPSNGSHGPYKEGVLLGLYRRDHEEPVPIIDVRTLIAEDLEELSNQATEEAAS